MKQTHLLAILVMVFIFSSFAPAKNLDNNYIETFFSRKLDINDLARIKSELSTKNIQLNYSSLGFDNEGKLLKISYSVAVPNKFSGADQSDDLKDEIGFIISTDPNSKFGIIVGKKESIEKRLLVLENKN